jgi:TolB-like protein/Flp pilus assembly protein TadD
MTTFSLKDFLKEARRRRVFRVTAIYIVGAWVALQAADLAFPGLGIEESAILYVWIGAIVGLPIALFFGWRYDIIGGRIVRTAVSDVDADLSIERADYIILAALSVVVVAIAFGLIGEISKTRGPETTQFALTDVHPKSIAVLPFLNMSDDPDQEYFSDGISEDILNLLAKVPEMRVTSRSSAFSFKGQNLDVPTMAAKLNVAHVLEGSVRKSGNQLRIVAQLIEVESDTHLWSETYDRELEDIFAVQDDIAEAVVDALKITLMGKKPKAIETSPEAYALYLQAQHSINQYDADSVQQAERLLKKALEIDSGFAPALTALGIVYQQQADPFAIRSLDEAYELSRDAIQNALAIDPQYGPAFAALSTIDIYYDWNFTAAEQHVRQALALNPGNSGILMKTAELNHILGRPDEAIDFYRQAITLDPVSYMVHLYMSFSYFRTQRLDEAADSTKLAMSLNPDGFGAHYLLGIVLVRQGDAPEALVEMERETAKYLRLQGTALVQHALGDAQASEAALQELIACCAAGSSYQVAEVYAFRGEIDHAFDWLEKAYDNRDGGLPLILDSPVFAEFHDDPRWEPFLDKMGLPHE